MPGLALRSAFAVDADWREALGRCLNHVRPDVQDTLGFLYLSDRFAADIDAVLELCRVRSGVAHWVGSVGIGVIGSGTGAVDEPAVSLMVGRFPADGFRVFSGRHPLPRDSAARFPFAVVHADPQTPDMADLVGDMAGKVGTGYLTGGVSSARTTAWQIADDRFQGGLSGVAFGAQVGVATGLSQSCSTLPPRHSITECGENLVISLDGQPALERWLTAAGDPDGRNLAAAAQRLLVGLPNPASDGDDMIVRHVVGVDPSRGAIVIPATVDVGQPLVFCLRDPAAARADMRRLLERLAAAHPQPQGALYFSCLGRGGNLFHDDATEARLIRDTFGDIPLAGFYCGGEIAGDRLYGYTGVLTLFV